MNEQYQPTRENKLETCLGCGCKFQLRYMVTAWVCPYYACKWCAFEFSVAIRVAR